MGIHNYDSWLLSGPGGPDDIGREPSDLVDGVLALLEEAGAPQDVCDAVVKLIETWEQSKVEPEPDFGPPPDDYYD